MPRRHLARLLFRWNRLSILPPGEKNSVAPGFILPPEIWDIIFHDLADMDLLRNAVVCRAFNTLCIHIYLARHNMSPHPVGSGRFLIFSHIIRPLQLSCDTPEITQLVCHFWSFGVYHSLMSLRDLIKRSNTLREIILTFSGDLFKTHNFVQRNPYSQSDVLRSFCTMLSTMAAKAHGPVIVAFSHALFTCHAKDIAAWRLDLFQFSGGMTPRALIKRMGRALPGLTVHPRATVRLYNGQTSSQWALTEIITVNVLSVQNKDGPGPFRSYTIIIFNIAFITRLYLYGRADIPVEQWTAMLPHLTFPALRHLNVSTNGIEPRALGEFLVRHVKLERFDYYPLNPIDGPAPSPISPPIAHPSLTQIVTHGVENTNRVMECLHRSPLLDSFSFSIPGQHTSIAELNSAFRLIAEHSHNAHLRLDFWSMFAQERDRARTHFMDDEAADIARALQCILSVELSFSSVVVAFRTLPWLALFPGLRCVTFHLHIGGRDPKRRRGEDLAVQAELADFMREATASLPHVQDIGGDVW
ncbi:hypothetical protein FB451DRAFT_1214963 [Mycena latifolia]|nr:hypothetical protein FB451DRAFT_1214963 [Mycena latifolia]